MAGGGGGGERVNGHLLLLCQPKTGNILQDFWWKKPFTRTFLPGALPLLYILEVELFGTNN